MPESAESAAISVPLSEVARIAGVGRAAVSNWRRRHETFPSPVGGTDASPLFSLAEVEAWLHREGKLKAAVGPLERLWPEYEALGDRDAMGLLVAEVGLRLYGEPSEPKDSGQAATSALGAGQSGLDERQSALLERTLRLAEGKGAAETFGFLLERWLRTHVIDESSRESAEFRIRRHVLPYFGDRALASIKPSDIREWDQALADKLAVSTRSTTFAHLRTIFCRLCRRFTKRPGT